MAIAILRAAKRKAFRRIADRYEAIPKIGPLESYLCPKCNESEPAYKLGTKSIDEYLDLPVALGDLVRVRGEWVG
ncbi:hypothetical protein GS415_03965 [Rhodococcus hoagii]|nr:hypothetical protein [Prescottella equi]